MHSKGNNKQNEEMTHRLGENICKCCDWQGIKSPKFTNSSAHDAQQHQNKQPNQKNWQKTSIDSSPKKTYKWPTGTGKDVQYHQLLEKCNQNYS